MSTWMGGQFQERDANGLNASDSRSALTEGPVPPGAMKRPAALEEYPSEGSKGHPLTCASTAQ